jgi:ketosteroid isomerase-like protein
VRDTAQKILSTNFDNEEHDQATIRYLAYQKGKLELLQALLKDDFEVEQPTQTQQGE